MLHSWHNSLPYCVHEIIIIRRRNGLFGVAASAELCTIRNNAKNTMFMLKQVVN